MRILGRIVGVQRTEQSVGIIVGDFDTHIMILRSQKIFLTFPYTKQKKPEYLFIYSSLSYLFHFSYPYT